MIIHHVILVVTAVIVIGALSVKVDTWTACLGWGMKWKRIRVEYYSQDHSSDKQ